MCPTGPKSSRINAKGRLLSTKVDQSRSMSTEIFFLRTDGPLPGAAEMDAIHAGSFGWTGMKMTAQHGFRDSASLDKKGAALAGQFLHAIGVEALSERFCAVLRPLSPSFVSSRLGPVIYSLSVFRRPSLWPVVRAYVRVAHLKAVCSGVFAVLVILRRSKFPFVRFPCQFTANQERDRADSWPVRRRGCLAEPLSFNEEAVQIS